MRNDLGSDWLFDLMFILGAVAALALVAVFVILALGVPHA